ncbi:DUF4142 domain-containing protein [Pedobacter sp. MC2016-14]|uniref:DUF4142 domain-containing protein n=1 Tax=Pedobacter sp. MC2016-14 TaxID=2897327 RepID=UPI001E418EE4|nr:DUF4142 domain-containing protein [Pedobacter sp. MC2016-14]MCD0486914.1 DUF4142 domain-containing protein [Pedobacter sp. MC2016-14]
MKTTNFITTCITAACLLAACQSPEQRSTDQKDGLTPKKELDSLQKNNESPEQKKAEGNDSQRAETYKSDADEDGAIFMKTAAIGGMMEVQSGQYALKTTKNADVKAFAQQMVTDHTKANAELKALATDLKIILPDEYPADQKKHLDMMMTMKGSEFDKHYMDMMLNDHVKTLDLFKAAQNNKNEKIKNFAKKTLPVLEKHHAKAKEIDAKIK